MRVVHLLLAFFLSSLATSASADEHNLRKLLSPNEARAWHAVGLLQMGNRSTCTGTLIASNQVLTAAHCMFDQKTKRQFDAEDVQFLTGWRLGRAVSYRQARRIVVHNDYRNTEYNGKTRRDVVATDLALIELDRDVDPNHAVPFDIYDQPSVGDRLTVVSYAKDRNDAPSIEEGCRVLARDDRVLMADCHIDFGASGAPIFSVIDGVPKISSVVSAKGERDDGRKISFGVALGKPLQKLHDQLKFDKSVFQGKRKGGSIANQLGRK